MHILTAGFLSGMAEEEVKRESPLSGNIPRCSSFPDRGAMKSNHRRSFSADDWREVDKELIIEAMVADASADADRIVRLSRASSDQNISPSSSNALSGTARQEMWGVRDGVSSPGAASPLRRFSDTTGMHSPSGRLLEAPGETPQRPTRRQGVDGSPVRYPSSGDLSSIYVDHQSGRSSSNGAASMLSPSSIYALEPNTNTRTNADTNTHTYIQTYIHTYKQTCMHTYALHAKISLFLSLSFYVFSPFMISQGGAENAGTLSLLSPL